MIFSSYFKSHNNLYRSTWRKILSNKFWIWTSDLICHVIYINWSLFRKIFSAIHHTPSRSVMIPGDLRCLNLKSWTSKQSSASEWTSTEMENNAFSVEFKIKNKLQKCNNDTKKGTNFQIFKLWSEMWHSCQSAFPACSKCWVWYCLFIIPVLGR